MHDTSIDGRRIRLRVGAVCSQIKGEPRDCRDSRRCESLLGGAGAQERYLVGKARDWIAAHRAEMTLSLRITVAGLIALAIGELLGVTQVYWAVLTGVIVMQASVGGSLEAIYRTKRWVIKLVERWASRLD